MSAALIPDLQGTGLDSGPAPLWIIADKETHKKRVFLVHPDYLADPHTADELSAVVTYEGQPIEKNGETLTVGLVPVWLRYAIQHAVNGRAEVYPQHVFAEKHKKLHIDTFRFRGERMSDDPDKIYIPWVRDAVAWKHDTRNPGRLCPLGTHIESQAPKKGAQVYDPARDELVSAQAEAVRTDLAAQLAEERRRREELEAKVNALAGMTAKPAKAAKPQVTAKCGTWTGDANRLGAHERFCRKGCKEAANVPAQA